MFSVLFFSMAMAHAICEFEKLGDSNLQKIKIGEKTIYTYFLAEQIEQLEGVTKVFTDHNADKAKGKLADANAVSKFKKLLNDPKHSKSFAKSNADVETIKRLVEQDEAKWIGLGMLPGEDVDLVSSIDLHTDFTQDKAQFTMLGVSEAEAEKLIILSREPYEIAQAKSPEKFEAIKMIGMYDELLKKHAADADDETDKLLNDFQDKLNEEQWSATARKQGVAFIRQADADFDAGIPLSEEDVQKRLSSFTDSKVKDEARKYYELLKTSQQALDGMDQFVAKLTVAKPKDNLLVMQGRHQPGLMKSLKEVCLQKTGPGKPVEEKTSDPTKI